MLCHGFYLYGFSLTCYVSFHQTFVEERKNKERSSAWKRHTSINTLWPRQNGRHFADDTFKRIFMNENVRISINISLKFVHTGLINNIPALVQIMAWRRPGDKPLSDPVVVRLLTHICVTRPQWVKCSSSSISSVMQKRHVLYDASSLGFWCLPVSIRKICELVLNLLRDRLILWCFT